MNTYAKAECHSCHIRLPKNEMHSEEITYNSGHSGISFSFGGKCPRMNTGRQYYRNKTIWYCKDCSDNTPKKIFYLILLDSFIKETKNDET